ncbi:MAG: 50S ribosomal protein L17 [Saprospiraceae bacterium]|jgi:large subunit ribosomal protein L17|nr:50S ribosomal protein L17 [Saprospiraceae bacterium]
MRHGDKVNNLGRKKGHREAMLKNMASSLILHKRITTTLAKAKALRVYAEPIINRAKENTTHNRRVAFSYLQNKEVLQELFGSVAEKIADRPGGYLRIIKLGFRRSDGSDMAMVELVDFNDVYTSGTKAAGDSKAKTRRSRRSGAGKTGVAAATTVAATAAVANEVSKEQSSEEE